MIILIIYIYVTITDVELKGKGTNLIIIIILSIISILHYSIKEKLTHQRISKQFFDEVDIVTEDYKYNYYKNDNLKINVFLPKNDILCPLKYYL